MRSISLPLRIAAFSLGLMLTGMTHTLHCAPRSILKLVIEFRLSVCLNKSSVQIKFMRLNKPYPVEQLNIDASSITHTLAEKQPAQTQPACPSKHVERRRAERYSCHIHPYYGIVGRYLSVATIYLRYTILIIWLYSPACKRAK